MILVTGATGKIGSALVEQLQAQGTPFRALVSSDASYERLTAQGIETVQADVQDADLTPAFAGIDCLFLLTPSRPDQADIERRMVDAARQAGVRHVVKQSALGADDPDVSLFSAHLEVEGYIRASGLSYTFLRPNLFMQNLGAVDAPLVKQQHAIFNSAGDGKVSFIDARDIAAVALAALQDDQHSGQTFELTGPEALSYGDAADKLTALLRHRVNYVPLDDDAYRGALESAGLSAWYAGGLSDLYRFYREGKAAIVTDTVEQVTGRVARMLDAYLTKHRAVFA